MVNMYNKTILTFLYFIQGLPYGLQSQFLPIYLHSKANINVSKVSFLKFLSVPWIFKFAWGPLVDSCSTKRKWLCATSFILCIVCLIGSFVTPHDVILIGTILFLLNLFTSIQDVVVDATALSLLNTEDLAIGNIAQVVGYKLGSIFSGGILTSFIDLIGWMALFCIIAIFYAQAAILAFLSPTLCQFEQQELSEDKNGNREAEIVEKDVTIYNGSPKSCTEKFDGKTKRYGTCELLAKIFSNSGALWLISFLLIYKLGEQGSLSMLPLYLLHVGVASDDVTFWISIIGQALSIFGSILGGVITKFTSRTIPIQVLLRQICMLRLLPLTFQLLIINAWNHNILSKHSLLCAMVASSQLLLLLSGIVTTTTFTYMMQTSKTVPKQIQATHYAVVSAAEVFGKLMFVSCAGWIVETFDYNVAFLLFAMLMVLVLPVFDKLSKINNSNQEVIKDTKLN